MKLPVPEPSVVLLPETVGFWDVPQQTPLAVTDEPPSLLILPPPVAETEVILVIADVDNEAVSPGVVALAVDE